MAHHPAQNDIYRINRRPITLPRDSIVFMGALVPVLVANSIDGGAHITSAGFILGWCLILWAEALYAVFALNVLQTANTATYTAPAHMDSKPRHLAAILETGCDDDLHYRTLRMTGEALNAPNCCVMAAAGITGFAAACNVGGGACFCTGRT